MDKFVIKSEVEVWYTAHTNDMNRWILTNYKVSPQMTLTMSMTLADLCPLFSLARVHRNLTKGPITALVTVELFIIYSLHLKRRRQFE